MDDIGHTEIPGYGSIAFSWEWVKSIRRERIAARKAAKEQSNRTYYDEDGNPVAQKGGDYNVQR